MTTRALHFDGHHAHTTTINGEAVSDYGAYLHSQEDDSLDLPALPSDLPMVEPKKNGRHNPNTDTKERARLAGKGRVRMASLKRAAAKRALRIGVTIGLDDRAYKRLGAAKQEAFKVERKKLAWVTPGKRWDWDRDFFWHDERSVPLELLRFGHAKPQPRQSFTQWYMEGNSECR